MLTQIKQVCMTYVTQSYTWYALAFFGLVVVPNVIVSAGPKRGTADAAGPLMFVLGMPLLGLAPLLVGHAKMQFGHPRARLIAHFRTAHLAVLAGILLTFFVALPLGESRIAGVAPLGVLALAAAIGAPAIWGAHFNRFAAMLISLVVFYSLLTSWGVNWWLIDTSQHVAIHAAIFAAGLLLQIAWLWRLSRLREEMDDYQNIYQAMLARRSGSEAIEQRRLVASFMGRHLLTAAISDKWYERIGSYYGGSFSGLVRVLQYGFATAPMAFQGLFIAAMVLCIGIFFTQFSLLSSSGRLSGSFFFIAQFGVILPGIIAGETLAQRRPRIAFELLLPISRAQLIDGLFAAAARNTFTLWLMLNTALGIVVSMLNEPPSLGAVAMFLLLSAATTLAAMGIGLRTAVWPQYTKRYFVLWLSWLALMPALIAWATLRQSIGDWPFIITALFLTAAGVVAIDRARRAWLNLELA